jgi:uncharacterized membrane protein YeaQ/YmgE (transglycosylase-associated protein family)
MIRFFIGTILSFRSLVSLFLKNNHHISTKKEVHMGIITWVILGLIVGIIAKFIMPGKDPGGIFITILLGIAGAFVGGFIASAIGFGSVTGFDIRSLLIAVGGAVLLLIIYRVIKK